MDVQIYGSHTEGAIARPGTPALLRFLLRYLSRRRAVLLEIELQFWPMDAIDLPSSLRSNPLLRLRHATS
jgi:hypothetical protein